MMCTQKKETSYLLVVDDELAREEIYDQLLKYYKNGVDDYNTIIDYLADIKHSLITGGGMIKIDGENSVISLPATIELNKSVQIKELNKEDDCKNGCIPQTNITDLYTITVNIFPVDNTEKHVYSINIWDEQEAYYMANVSKYSWEDPKKIKKRILKEVCEFFKAIDIDTRKMFNITVSSRDL